jgi:tRNA 2-selenouridine synthase
MLDAGAFKPLARALMDEHYDPTYRSGRTRNAAEVLQRFNVNGLAEADSDVLAARIAEWVTSIS